MKTGWRWIANGRYAEVRVRKGKRETFPLSGCASDAEATERAARLRELATLLIAGGRGDKVKPLGLRLGRARTKLEIEDVFAAARLATSADAPRAKGETFEEFALLWTTGELHAMFPDHVSKKATSKDDAEIFKKHVNPRIGRVPLVEIDLAHGEEVMRKLPRELGRARRRHVAQAMHRLLSLAVYPAKRIQRHPFPEHFLPRLGAPKAKSFLYPDEDVKLMACVEVPLEERMLYGVLAREGMRLSELIGGERKGVIFAPLAWVDLDLEHGVYKLDRNKTKRPRSWALNVGVRDAFIAWKHIAAPKSDDEPVLANVPVKHADKLRDHLKLAGVKRAELFASTDERLQIRAHDLRGTFVTLSLANGHTETWVMDRTGHTSSEMINRYRQAARTAAELHLGPLKPLVDAIPELAAVHRTLNKGKRGLPGGKRTAEQGGGKVAQSGSANRAKTRRSGS